MTFTRAIVIVLDSAGIGELPDAPTYGDEGSDTIGNIAKQVPLRLPTLRALGLNRVAAIGDDAWNDSAVGAFGRMAEASAGKDSVTGHWEMMGIVLERPFPVFPHGFDRAIVDEFSRLTGRGVLANKAASGTAIIEEFGAEHQASGKWIVYTSADSVFQVAAHEATVPLPELYAACRIGREMLAGQHGVSRVIARPFEGPAGGYVRTANRKDFSLPPSGTTLLDTLEAAGIPRVGVGKVDDLFAGRGISSTHTATNAEAYRLIRDALATMESGFLFVNVIEFDQTWGHRNDVPGFLGGLEELDRALPRLLEAVQEEDLVIFTADHGNDPTTPSTDHSRERVPVLVYGPRVRAVSVGERRTFADIGATVAEFLGVAPLAAGSSFLREVWGG